MSNPSVRVQQWVAALIVAAFLSGVGAWASAINERISNLERAQVSFAKMEQKIDDMSSRTGRIEDKLDQHMRERHADGDHK